VTRPGQLVRGPPSRPYEKLPKGLDEPEGPYINELFGELSNA
jgi:hypothetical protein